MQISYPSAPINVSLEKLQPSKAFKKQVVNTLFSIIAFFVVYFLLVFAAIGLAIACLYIGGFIIAAHPSFITLSIGIGLIALAISVIFFLIKFIFAVSKNINPSRIQLTESEQPALFEFIRRITKETHTPFPKKIFLSPDVNACVFYNSSFWSTVFPIRKNLEIGLGLVNSVNLSEFKAVMAHEFGHFSQRSMKLGSFTYSVNRIIYNMLYDNKGYTSFLNAWARGGSVLAFFAAVTARIAQSIQWILREMYKLVNKSYMGLSREMEFHADAVAASVSGGNNLVSGLARIDIAAVSYQRTLDKADEWFKEKRIAKNLFSNQSTLYKGLATESNLQMKNGLPIISSSFVESYSTSRINYKNQWASHPSFIDRKQHLEQLEMNVTADENTAWIVFDNSEAVQEQMTAHLYKNIPDEKSNMVEYGDDFFDDWYFSERNRYQLPAIYNGFYDKRYVAIEEWDIELLGNTRSTLQFDDIFSVEHGNLQTSIQSIYSDIVIVEAIKNKQIDVKSFDFDGTKYLAKDADKVITSLKQEVENLQEKLSSLDKETYSFFYEHAGIHQADIKRSYLLLQEQSNRNKDFAASMQKLYEKISPLYQSGNTIEFVTSSIATLKNYHEPKLKKFLQEMIESSEYSKEITEATLQLVNDFIKGSNRYYHDTEFRNNELNELNEVINKTTAILDNRKFDLYKNVLTKQLSFIEK